MNDVYVELQNINERFGAYQATDNVSFSIEKGRLIGLLGLPGNDKTTILRIIIGLETLDSGTITINDQRVNDLSASDWGIGFTFQNHVLFRYMTVFDNIAFRLEVQKKDKGYISDRVGELIRLIRLEGLERRRPYQLFDGQRQQVAFARTLAPNPRLPLLDEPLAVIDTKVRKELHSWLRETVNKVGITSIFVTRNREEAAEVTDEIVTTNQDCIERTRISVNIYKNPTTPFAARLIEESIKVEDYGRLYGFENEEGYIKVVLRPEFARVTRTDQEIYPYASERGVVEDIFPRGNVLELRLNVNGTRLIAYRSLRDDPFVIEEEVSISIYRLYLYSDHQVYLVENASLKSEQTLMV